MDSQKPKLSKFSLETLELGIDDMQFPEIDPKNILLLPTLDMVLFPGLALFVGLTREQSARSIEKAFEQKKPVAIFCQPSNVERYPAEIKDIERFGVAAQVLKVVTQPDGSKGAFIRAYPKLILECIGFQHDADGDISLSVAIKEEIVAKKPDSRLNAIIDEVIERSKNILGTDPANLMAISQMIDALRDNPADIINHLATHLPFPILIKQRLLRQRYVIKRGEMMLFELENSDEILKSSIKNEVDSQVRENLEDQRRRSILQAQYDVLHTELFGDEDEEQELKRKADECGLPESVRKVFDKELRKMSRFNPQSPDYAVLYSYLETLTMLPWNRSSEINSDFEKAEQILEEDHYGMKEVKDRILENLALHISQGRKDSPVICLVGAPGVGKTSVGRSIARALGREYQRISLGGLHDESEIRGHRRTYIGSMPGRIVSALLNAKVNNPVMLLDEIDKLGADFKGDPNAALLEVMDPAQNSHFHDNYIDVDFDLSDVFFIATANTLDTVPRPLLDRMEIIEMPGYLPEEKLTIAHRHLIPRIREKHGLKAEEFDLTDKAISKIIEGYTAESGVRNLEKKIAELSRKVILGRLRRKDNPAAAPTILDEDDVVRLLGVERYLPPEKQHATGIGVATGLAWTAIGGDTLEIETSFSPAKGERLTLTGNLGDVMKESAMLSWQYVRAHAHDFNISPDKLENIELHLHVPEGAVPKDGPSAGITITTAILSLFTEKRVRPGVAMTGEMTLQGRVLPVGGIKEKLLAAKRSGITDIYLSRRNEPNVREIDSKLLTGLNFHYVDHYSDMKDIFVND